MTILVEVEAVVNSCPLVYVDEDINSSMVLAYSFGFLIALFSTCYSLYLLSMVQTSLVINIHSIQISAHHSLIIAC